MSMRKISCLLCPLVAFLVMGASACDSNGTGKKSHTPLEAKWRYAYDIAGSVRLPPRVVGDTLVLFSAEARLTALRTVDGSLSWKSARVENPISELYSEELAIVGNKVYGSHVDQALVWDITSGDIVWRFEPPSQRRFYNSGYFGGGSGLGYFYGSGSGSWLYVLNKQSGSLEYRRQYEYGVRGTTYDDGMLYFTQAWTPEGAKGQSKGGIMKVDAATGDSLWNFRTPRGGFYRMRPFVEDGVVYAGTDGGENTVFVALDAATGEVLWRNTRARVYAAEMVDGKIFVNDGSDLLALDKDDGSILWRARLDAGHGESGLAYLDGYVYHPHGQAMRVVNAETGEIVHIEAPPDGSYFWEVGAGAGKVFAQSSSNLIAYQPYQSE